MLQFQMFLKQGAAREGRRLLLVRAQGWAVPPLGKWQVRRGEEGAVTEPGIESGF